MLSAWTFALAWGLLRAFRDTGLDPDHGVVPTMVLDRTDRFDPAAPHRLGQDISGLIGLVRWSERAFYRDTLK